jgi:CheY-like chemotaxis protein
MAEFARRILVVEDDLPLAAMLEALFCHARHEVRIATNGFEALAMMRKTLPDLITVDLEMPTMSGFEFLSVVRRRFPHIPVIVISGNIQGEEEYLLADALFLKGEFVPEQLLQAAEYFMDEPPDRPYPVKPSQAPVWVYRSGGYYVVTCPECLRSSPITPDRTREGIQEGRCIHCGATLRFILEPKRRDWAA